jgi:6-phosphogluconolactonase
MDQVIASVDTLGEALAADFAVESARAFAARGRFTIAIPGGSIATTFFPRLARASVDWSRTEFFWTDERGVPPDDPESNYGLARTLWLEPVAIPLSNVHRMPADSPHLETAAREHAAELKRVAGDPPVLDFVLLGVGVDGHVASVFPRDPDTRKATEYVIAVTDAPKPPPRRMSLALPVLMSARRCVVAALGASKASVIHEAMDNRESTLPVASILRRSGRTLLLLDRDAAASLTGGARALAGKSPRQ